MAKINTLRKSPAVAEGMGVTEFLNDSMEAVATDLVNYNDTSPEVLLRVPANTLVDKVLVEVVTGFNGTIPSVTFGTSGTPALLVGANDFDCTTAGMYVVSKPSKFTSDTSLQATIVAGGGGSQGQLRFWVVYRSRSTFLA